MFILPNLNTLYISFNTAALDTLPISYPSPSPHDQAMNIYIEQADARHTQILLQVKSIHS